MLKSIVRAAVLLLTLAAGIASAQQFPTKPITLICPWPAGGASDLVMRAFAEAVGKQLGQNMIVENRPGASGTMGAATLVNAQPDGYTLTQLPISVFRTPLMNKMTFDPLKDITYIINVTGYTFGMVVRADAPWKDISEFVAYAKANPEKITYGTPGTGTTPHLAVEQFALKAGIKLSHIPFKGFAENAQSLLGGHTLALSDSTGWAPHVDAGKMRLLATYGSKRTKRWPQVPTLLDAGYDTVSDSPFGFGGPKGMDPKVVKILHDAFKKAMDDPKVISMLERYDQPVIYMSGEDYTRFAKKTMEEEKPLIERLGMGIKN
ncbi:MAG: tripartite tricarboxylate transporter substrate binding protein [Proteobacteria bacterium]|nr:tripartite tricarboxylate transporter substrate binding protein [Pseudomonadota bacterium]